MFSNRPAIPLISSSSVMWSVSSVSTAPGSMIVTRMWCSGRKLHADALGKGAHGELGSAVDGAALKHPPPGHRRDVDDVAAASCS